MSQSFLGVDVSQGFLDAHARPANQSRRFANDPSGVAELVAWARSFSPERIVFESTGICQKLAVGALLTQGLPAVIVNARQARDFAKGMGKLAKTDPLDASILAHFGEVVPTVVKPLESKEILELREFYDRRSQLVRMLAAEKNHHHAAKQGSAKVLKTIIRHIGYLEKQILELEERMDRIVESSAAFRAKDEILQSIVGVGPQVSRTLIAHMPELGQCTRQSIAALAGVAPYNDDSGKTSRTRRISGGRGKVRIGLYQAAVAAINHCPKMKAFYASLKARGKASKVAIVAVARKILVLANALLRTMTPYQKTANSVC